MHPVSEIVLMHSRLLGKCEIKPSARTGLMTHDVCYKHQTEPAWKVVLKVVSKLSMLLMNYFAACCAATVMACRQRREASQAMMMMTTSNVSVKH